MSTSGQSGICDWDQLAGFTPRARKIFQLANQEAHRLNHNYRGTEHLLLGLVKDDVGVASQVLRTADCFLPKVRWEVEKLVPPGTVILTPGGLACAPDFLDAMERAGEHAKELNHDRAGTGHLLLALLFLSEVRGSQLLGEVVRDVSELRSRVLTALASTNWPLVEQYVNWGDSWSGPCPALEPPP